VRGEAAGFVEDEKTVHLAPQVLLYRCTFLLSYLLPGGTPLDKSAKVLYLKWLRSYFNAKVLISDTLILKYLV
jgi:hypothetical protein